MGKFDNATRKECIAKLRDSRPSIREARAQLRVTTGSRAALLRAELALRNEAIELRQRLEQIEREERDACSIALQMATLEAEEARAKT